MKNLILIITALSALSSCATGNTEIHLYTQGVSESEINRTTEILSESGYEIYLNDLDIPEDIKGPTIVYSPLNPHLSSVDSIKDILSDMGYKNIDLIPFRVDNHSYTRKHIGIYLHRYIPPSRSGVNIKSIMKEYHGVCHEADVFLNLVNINVFKLTRIEWDESSEKEIKSVSRGLWNIIDGDLYIYTNDHNMAFKINKFKEEQGGRNINVIKLTKKTDSSKITDCNFEYREIDYS